MYRVILFIASVIVFSNAWSETIRLSAPTVTDATSETFGEPINESLASVDIATLAAEPERYLGQPMLIRTKINKVCQKKGCFFIAQQDDHIMRVSFKDYGFFIPTNSGNKSVALNGQLIQKDLSPAQATHFNSDLNDNATTLNAGVVYEIVASGIKIPIS